jgi:hypothetical protein
MAAQQRLAGLHRFELKLAAGAFKLELTARGTHLIFSCQLQLELSAKTLIGSTVC